MVALVLAAVTAMPLASQARNGVVTGTVKDNTGAPIENVEVSVPAIAATRTDTAGHFVLASLPPGATDVTFRRLAFSPAILTIQVPRDDTTDVEVTLTVVAHQLKGVVVQEDADYLRQLAGFEARRKSGLGHFITRAQIEKRNSTRLSDVVRTIPGVVLLPASNGQVVLRFGREQRQSCPPQFFIDGIQATGFNIDDMPAGDVEGIELYSGSATLPPEFNKFTSTVICGAVIIWTRIPGT
jgi:hypothetical protein